MDAVNTISSTIKERREGICLNVKEGANKLPIVSDYRIICEYLSTHSIIPDRVYKDYRNKYITRNKITNLSEAEILGLSDVYEFIEKYSFKDNCNFNVYEVITINTMLFGHTKYPEYAGRFRNSAAGITLVDLELTNYNDICARMQELNGKFKKLVKKSHCIEAYLNRAIELNALFIKTSPFTVGNERTALALFNLLVKYVALPPIHIENNERHYYYDALEKAICNKDMKQLNEFLLTKLGAAVLELCKDSLN